MRARVCVLLTALIGASASLADVVDVPAAADATLYEEPFGTLANGAGDYFFAGRTDQGLIRRAVIAFDLAAALPAGATITSATLTLHMSRTNTGPQVVSLHRTLASWTEGTTDAPGQEGSGWPAGPGDVTWAYRTFDTVQWTNLGGDFADDVSATTLVGGVDDYHWTGDALAADVAAWAANGAANFGWTLVGDEEFTTTSKRFDSRSNPEPAFRPSLQIEYVIVPGPGTGALVLGAGAGVGLRRRRSARRISRT